MNQVAIVTGGTSGIGLAAAEALKKAGYRVYALSRSGFTTGSAKAGIESRICDVTSEEAVNTVIDDIFQETGRIDLVVNCAGFGISGAIEFTETADAKRLMDTDFFGTVNVNKAVIPLMRTQQLPDKASKKPAEQGRIINISSVAGPAAIPFQAFYSSAKAAMDAYSAALANELKPFRITVTAIRPGDVRTGFTAAREKKHAGDDIYDGRIGLSVGKMEKDEQTGMKPEVLGAYILKIARRQNPKPFYTPGIVYKACIVLIKLLPCRLVNDLIGLLYVVHKHK